MIFSLIGVEKSLILIVLSQHVVNHNTVELLWIVIFFIDDDILIKT